MQTESFNAYDETSTIEYLSFDLKSSEKSRMYIIWELWGILLYSLITKLLIYLPGYGGGTNKLSALQKVHHDISKIRNNS